MVIGVDVILNFSIYILIGIVNTIIHWSAFYLFYEFELGQKYCNLFAFIFSASFSYFANSKFNFKKRMNIKTYGNFIIVVGVITYTIGLCADLFSIKPLYTLIASSLLSLVLGFSFSKFFVFR
ncbi:GtrA family protein [Vibrio diabolicus]|uniref:GtrA family protein n=1 Tax=Vibrio diabolicus TaxID=50719 RepID=UPI00280D05AF|nr:GtrA family protein [Vibrio diabolicus]